MSAGDWIVEVPGKAEGAPPRLKLTLHLPAALDDATKALNALSEAFPGAIMRIENADEPRWLG